MICNYDIARSLAVTFYNPLSPPANDVPTLKMLKIIVRLMQPSLYAVSYTHLRITPKIPFVAKPINITLFPVCLVSYHEFQHLGDYMLDTIFLQNLWTSGAKKRSKIWINRKNPVRCQSIVNFNKMWMFGIFSVYCMIVCLKLSLYSTEYTSFK